jgi:VanZ family protein
MPRLRPWIPVAVWAAVIFFFSTDVFSSEHTRGIVVGVLHVLLPSARGETLLILHDFLRKCGHFVNYFIFGLLLFRAIRAAARGWQVRWAWIAILIAALYAASDEFHQSFVPSRGPSPWDVLLDTVGAAAAQLALWWIIRRGSAGQSDAAQPRIS